MTKLDIVLEMAGISLVRLMIANHAKEFLNLSARIIGDEIVAVASRNYNSVVANNDDWTSIINLGTGFSNPCNCDDCKKGMVNVYSKKSYELTKRINDFLSEYELSKDIVQRVKKPTSPVLSYILKRANISISDIVRTSHEQGVFNVCVKLDDGKVSDASVIYQSEKLCDNKYGWEKIACYGTGNDVCKCVICKNNLKDKTRFNTREEREYLESVVEDLELSDKRINAVL